MADPARRSLESVIVVESNDPVEALWRQHVVKYRHPNVRLLKRHERESSMFLARFFAIRSSGSEVSKFLGVSWPSDLPFVRFGVQAQKHHPFNNNYNEEDWLVGQPLIHIDCTAEFLKKTG